MEIYYLYVALFNELSNSSTLVVDYFYKSPKPVKTNKDDTTITACIDSETPVYPNFHLLLKIFASLPVSTATPERTFSAMKILKTYLRSTFSDENLQGLSMAYIFHKHLSINIDDIISKCRTEDPQTPVSVTL